MADPTTSNGRYLNSEYAFTCFQELPTEVRLAIWEHVASEPRLVPIRARSYQTYEGVNGDSVVIDQRTPVEVPAILRVNREAREVAAKFYTLTFGTKEFLSFRGHSSPVPLRVQPKVYINISIDLIYVDIKSLRRELERAPLDIAFNNLHTILLHQDFLKSPHASWVYFLRDLPHLKKIIFVAEGVDILQNGWRMDYYEKLEMVDIVESNRKWFSNAYHENWEHDIAIFLRQFEDPGFPRRPVSLDYRRRFPEGHVYVAPTVELKGLLKISKAPRQKQQRILIGR